MLKGHTDEVVSAVFSPGGKHIVSASSDKTAQICNSVTEECKAELKGHADEVVSAVFSPDDKHIVSVSSDKTAWIRIILEECKKMHAEFSMFVSNDYTTQIWDTFTPAGTGKFTAELVGHIDRVTSAVFSPDGCHIVSASDDCTAWIWNAFTGECEAELVWHTRGVNSAVFSPNGMHIVTTSSNKTRIWNIVTRECEAELERYTAIFSPNGMHICI